MVFRHGPLQREAGHAGSPGKQHSKQIGPKITIPRAHLSKSATWIATVVDLLLLPMWLHHSTAIMHLCETLAPTCSFMLLASLLPCCWHNPCDENKTKLNYFPLALPSKTGQMH